MHYIKVSKNVSISLKCVKDLLFNVHFKLLTSGFMTKMHHSDDGVKDCI